MVFPTYVSDQKFEHSINLLLLIYDKSQHYVYIKDFNRFMFHKTRNKKKMILQKLLTVFRSKNVLREHKKVCLSINGVQSVKVEEWTIELHKKVSRSRSL